MELITKEIRDASLELFSLYPKEIEKGVYNYCQEAITVLKISSGEALAYYNHKIKDLSMNLNYNSSINNHSLCFNLLMGDIKPADLAYMSPQELYIDNWKAIISKRDFMEQKSKNIATSDQYPCKRCKARKAVVTHLQTRSSDEPMTTFIACCECGFTFKK